MAHFWFKILNSNTLFLEISKIYFFLGGGGGGGGGLEDFVNIFGVIVKLDYFEGGHFYAFSSVLNIYGKSARLRLD